MFQFNAYLEIENIIGGRGNGEMGEWSVGVLEFPNRGVYPERSGLSGFRSAQDGGMLVRLFILQSQPISGKVILLNAFCNKSAK
jgi:hypothetical protein